MKIIIIGAGIAAVSAVKAIRQHNQDIKVTIYGEEPHFPYKRIRLTKDLADGIKEQKLLLEKESWYEENGVTIYRNKKVIRIDPKGRKIFMSDGTTDEYSSLLLANGARNSILPVKGINKKAVYTLRSLRDSQEILNQADKSKKVLVIGGGILGLEIAWNLIKLNKEVIVVEAFPRLMPRQLDEEASTILQRIVEDHGVTVYTGSQVREITGDAQVSGFITDQNTQQSCDMIVHSTGIYPNIELVQDTDISINRGIIVNERMQTSLPDIYAAGDVAEYQGTVAGLWNVASLQGEIAGKNMVGYEQSYESPAVAAVMNAFHYFMFSIGEVEDKNADWVMTNKPEINKYQKIIFNKGMITGALFMGGIKELPLVKKAMDQKLKFPEAYEKEMQISAFMSLIKEKQANKELQHVATALSVR